MNDKKTPSDDELKDISKFIFEVGSLKMVNRTGWWTIGIKNPESVAEHSFRSAVIGMILADLEGADEMKTMAICLFHDIPEARIGDINKINARYIESKAGDLKAQEEQLTFLPDSMSKKISKIVAEYNQESSKEGIVARDADLLEAAFQGKAYLDIGHKNAQNWIDNVRSILKTDSAKRLLDLMEKMHSDDWWQNLKKIRR